MDGFITRNGLSAPSEFWDLTPRQLEDISNGCGPKGWGWIVPDRFRLIGVDFKPACDIHDYCYHSRVDKKIADRVFQDNMLTIACRAHSGFIIIASYFAFTYFLAVKNGGAGAYNKANGGVE